MAIHYRTQGFVVKQTDRGEADQLFTIYTEEFGKLEILGKAVRKIKSKLRGGAAPFYLSEVEFIQGKAYKTLTDTILINGFPKIRKDLERLAIAQEIGETLDNLVVKEEKDEKVWQLLQETFGKLDSLGKPAIVYYYFFWQLVSILGYQPEISGCSIGGEKIDCDAVKIIKVIFKKDWSVLARLKLEPNHLKLLKDVSQWYNKNICN